MPYDERMRNVSPSRGYRIPRTTVRVTLEREPERTYLRATRAGDEGGSR
jgi:hypothetical protein